MSTAKGYSTSKNCGIQSIKYSNNVTYTIHLPEGVAVSSIDFQGFTNEDGVDGYLAQLNGKTFSSSDYVFPSRTGNQAVSYNVKLDTPASGSVSVKFVKQVGMRMTLNTVSTTGITPITLDVDSDSRTFNLGGQPAGKNSKGIIIQNGKKVYK